MGILEFQYFFRESLQAGEISTPQQQLAVICTYLVGEVSRILFYNENVQMPRQHVQHRRMNQIALQSKRRVIWRVFYNIW